MLLLTGPPASGKTSFCLGELRECLRKNRSDCRLLLPTTTMAEHLRNELAREGLVFPPRMVSTFGKFVSDYSKDLCPVSSSSLEMIVEEQLARLPDGRYSRVREFPGFRSAVMRAIEEFSGAGGTEIHLGATDPEFAAVSKATNAELALRKQYSRAARLRHAAEEIGRQAVPGKIWISGFFGFTPPELDVLLALDKRCDLTVTLADSAASAAALASLRMVATSERRLESNRTEPDRVLVTASTADAEANEIARRILELRNKGRAFREIGIIVRSENPSVPALRDGFERFGIPYRSYFAQPLRADATVRYLLGLVDAALSGWEFDRSLPVLRMHGSPLEVHGDQFEYEVFRSMPGRGFEALRVHAGNVAGEYFDSLSALTEWSSGTAVPAVWSERFSSLQSLFMPPRPTDAVDYQQALLWRTQNTAIELFTATVGVAASTLDPLVRISCYEFRAALGTAISSVSLHVVDRRRDAVHIIDAVEARQWRLPVVFLCGLLEAHFPKHYSEDPILGDAVRRELQAVGVPMRSTAQKQAEEQFLFDVALTRATGLLVLSYSQLNGKGEPNLASFLLDRAKPYRIEAAAAIKPHPTRERAGEPIAVIADEALLSAMAKRHSVLSPTKVETFLNCPWQFFAGRTLRLKERPAPPWERLDLRVQGTIGHAVFEVVFRDGASVEEAFDRVFREKCKASQVPEGYRTEAIRMELLHGVEQLVKDARLHARKGTVSLYEEKFEFDLGNGVRVAGQIDRLDFDKQRNAVVFDYKYKRKTRIDLTARENETGKRVQSGLYLAALQQMGYKPAGMVYAGFKRESSVSGWVLPGIHNELQSVASQEHMQEVAATARETTFRVFDEIASGRIQPSPVDARTCEWCNFIAVCRVEAVAEAAVAGEADGA